MTELQEYDFQLVYKPGNSQKKVDTLSRRPDHSQRKDNNKDQTVLKEEWFRNLTIQEKEFWKEVEEAEEFTKEVWEAIERSEEGWRWKERVILWKERIYVLDSATLWEEIVTKYHDSKLAGHPGYTKTHELIMRNYWWPQILEDVKWYVTVKGEKGTISLAQARDAVPGPNCMLKSLWGWIKNEGIKKRI